eukprot:158836-Prymnesium_polylepis.1
MLPGLQGADADKLPLLAHPFRRHRHRELRHAAHLEGRRRKGDLCRMRRRRHPQLKRQLVLDIVIGEGAAVLELLALEGKALLVGRDAFHALNFGLEVGD